MTLAKRLADIGVEEVLVMDGFDECAIGVLERFGMDPVLIYDKALVIEKLIDLAPGSTHEEAVEYYQFNQLGGWQGDLTPGFLVRLEDES
jgi:hypothetical protein